MVVHFNEFTRLVRALSHRQEQVHPLFTRPVGIMDNYLSIRHMLEKVRDAFREERGVEQVGSSLL